MNQKRIDYLDIIKGYVIIMTVFCHYPVMHADSYIGNAVMMFGWGTIPCFFMISGGLMHRMKELDWKKHLWRVAKMYLVLTIWRALYLVYFCIVWEVDPFHVADVLRYLFLFGEIGSVRTGAMWYIEAYIEMLLILPITHFLFSKGKEGRKILLFMLIVLGFSSFVVSSLKYATNGVFDLTELTGLVPLGEYKNMMFWFILGAFVLEYEKETRDFICAKVWRKFLPAIVFLLGLLGLLLFKFRITGAFTYDHVYLDDGFNLISSLLLGLGMYFIFSTRKNGRFSQFMGRVVGKETLGIFYLHVPVLVAYGRLCEKFIPNYTRYYSFLLTVVQTIIVLVICIGVSKLMKKIPVVKWLV